MSRLGAGADVIAVAPQESTFGLIRAAVVLFVLLTFLTGIVYPLLITGVAKVAFSNQAEGSLIDKDGKPTTDEKAAIGSLLIGQLFDQPQYFWSRPSATYATGSSTDMLPYNAGQSTGSNLGPSNIAGTIQPRVDALHQADKDAGATNNAPVPIDLVTASGSGLDPHESVAAAEFQIPRIAKVRNIDAAKLESLIAANTQQRSLGILGEKVVNVLTLNLALDKAAPFAVPAAATGTVPATK
jgi:K+-transporting ATPase ATPase C chain